MTKKAKSPLIYWLTTAIFVSLCAAVISLLGILYLVWVEPQENWNMAERVTGTIVTVLALAFACALLVPTWKQRNI